MTKFHYSRNGVGTCRATLGNCPFGDELHHFERQEDAQAAFETSMGGSFASQKTRLPLRGDDIDISKRNYSKTYAEGATSSHAVARLVEKRFAALGDEDPRRIPDILGAKYLPAGRLVADHAFHVSGKTLYIESDDDDLASTPGVTDVTEYDAEEYLYEVEVTDPKDRELLRASQDRALVRAYRDLRHPYLPHWAALPGGGTESPRLSKNFVLEAARKKADARAQRLKAGENKARSLPRLLDNVQETSRVVSRLSSILATAKSGDDPAIVKHLQVAVASAEDDAARALRAAQEAEKVRANHDKLKQEAATSKAAYEVELARERTRRRTAYVRELSLRHPARSEKAREAAAVEWVDSHPELIDSEW